MAEQRIAICSAKRDNRVLGYIEGSEAFDLFGRRRADYNPNTGLLYDLLDGGVVGYVTFDSKFAGLSRVADEMFPKTYEVAPQQSQEDYVNNLSIVGVPEAGEQRRAERIEPAGVVSETKSSPPPKTIEPAVEVSSSYTRQETIQQELISNSSGWIVAGEPVGHGGAEAVVSVSGVYEMPSLSGPEQGEVSAAAFSNAVHLSHLGSCQPELQSNVPSGSVADEVSGRRGAEYDFSIRENNETPVSAPPLQHEPGATFFPQSHDGAYQETRPGEPCSNDPDLCVTGARQGDVENELVSSINQMPSPPLAEHDEAAARTPIPKAYDNSPDEGAESERPSSDSGVLGVVETFMQRVAEYVDSIPNDSKETPSRPPFRQDEVANLGSNIDLRDTHREQLRGDGYAGAPVESFVEREVQDDSFSSTNENLASSQQDEEAETNFFSDSDDHNPSYEDLRGERYSESRGSPAAGASFGEAEAGDEANSLNETPSPTLSEQDEVAGANLYSKPDDHNPSQEDLRGERSSDGHGDLVASDSFGGAESEDEVKDINRTPSPSLSENGGQAGADLDSKSDDNSPEEHGPSQPYGNLVERGEVESGDELYSLNEETSASERDEEAGVNPDSKSDDHIFSSEHSHGNNHEERLSPLGAGNSFGDAVSGDELNNISDTPGELLSGQQEAEATPFSEPADDGSQENFESVLDANSTDIVGQRDAQDDDSVTGIEEKPNLPLIEQKEAEQSPLSYLNDDTYQESAASGQYLEHSPSAPAEPGVPTHLPGQQSAPDLAKAFFEVDLERAVAMARSELAKRGHGADPTADFFSVDLERAVDIVRKEFETKV